MKYLNILAVLISALAILSAPPAYAKNDAEKGKMKNATRDRAEQVAERAEKERGDLSRHDETVRDRGKDVDDIDDLDDAELDDVDMDGRGGRDNADKRSKKAATGGNEKAQEMRARRDERKEIKEEYKANRKNGEGKPDADGIVSDMEADEEIETDEKKGKKPWWKFWDE